MNFFKTAIRGLVIIEPKVFYDERGYFFESFVDNKLEENIKTKTYFVQENESFSHHGVLRGLHFQVPPFDQAKLVRVISGVVLDIAVDLRKTSPSYGKYFSLKLSSENHLQLYIPKGFAHGFVVLSENAIFSYKVDNFYSKPHESGIIWNDDNLHINWEIESDYVLVSEKDNKLQSFKDFNTPF